MPGDMSAGAVGVGVALRPVGVAMLAAPRLRNVRSLPIEP
jgi:hypothetical protein